MCIYGMESTGGYQLIGRTIPIWNTYGKIPWLLQFFDHVKFYLVDDDELIEKRKLYSLGKFKLEIENIMFSFKDYKNFIEKNKDSIFEFEVKHSINAISKKIDWNLYRNEGKVLNSCHEKKIENAEYVCKHLSDCSFIKSSTAGILYDIKVNIGDHVRKGQTIMQVELMKMNINVITPREGTVKTIFKESNCMIHPGDLLCAISY